MAEQNNAGCGCLTTILQMVGIVMAAIWSWTMNHSWAWAIFHAFCGWFYVIYHLIRWGAP